MQTLQLQTAGRRPRHAQMPLVALVALMQPLRAVYASRAAARGIIIRFRADPQVRVQLNLEQVLRELAPLVEVAIDAASSGELCLDLRVEQAEDFPVLRVRLMGMRHTEAQMDVPLFWRAVAAA